MSDEFRTVRVTKAWDEGPRLRALLLDLAGTGFAERFTTPGQYVRARLPGAPKDAFLALASAPGGGAEVELLVQKSGSSEPVTADAIATRGAGETLEITAPAGKGFPVDAQKHRDVVMLAGGSGISAIRSVVEHVAMHREDFGRAALLIGARTVGDLAYRSLFDGWRGGRIEVDAVLSRPLDGSWAGRVGYVTAALREMHLDPARTSAFVAGGKPFTAAALEALAGRGVAPERIFRNF